MIIPQQPILRKTNSPAAQGYFTCSLHLIQRINGHLNGINGCFNKQPFNLVKPPFIISIECGVIL